MWSSAGRRGGKKGTEEKAPEQESQSPARTENPPSTRLAGASEGQQASESQRDRRSVDRRLRAAPDKRDRLQTPQNALARWYDVRHLTPVRYPPTHKHATRRRILEAASQAFRERGVAETGVDEVMRRAGLTHGGFYSHFRDKSELVAEACTSAFDEAVPNLDRIA